MAMDEKYTAEIDEDPPVGWEHGGLVGQMCSQTGTRWLLGLETTTCLFEKSFGSKYQGFEPNGTGTEMQI